MLAFLRDLHFPRCSGNHLSFGPFPGQRRPRPPFKTFFLPKNGYKWRISVDLKDFFLLYQIIIEMQPVFSQIVQFLFIRLFGVFSYSRKGSPFFFRVSAFPARRRGAFFSLIYKMQIIPNIMLILSAGHTCRGPLFPFFAPAASFRRKKTPEQAYLRLLRRGAEGGI